MNFVEINKSDPSFSRIELIDILKIIEPRSDEFCWAIQFIYAAGEIRNLIGMSMLELEEKCRNSEFGVSIEFAKIKELAVVCNDIIDILIVGCKKGKTISRVFLNKKCDENCEIVIYREDSTIWELYSFSEEHMQLFQNLKKTENELD